VTTEARVISFDLDDTLWPVAPVIARAETALFTWLEKRYPRTVQGHDIDSMRALRIQVAADFPERRHDFTFLRSRALAVQFKAAGYPEALVDEAMEIFLTQRNRVELFADVRPSLERLRTRYRLFAMSNGNADIRRCGLGELFEGHVSAIAAGAAKPDPRIFSALARLARVSPAEVIHVGDDPVADIAGATEAGMHAVWINRHARAWPAGLASPARTIATLEEIC
jgi:putative hydrolase of the HAD superfamily